MSIRSSKSLRNFKSVFQLSLMAMFSLLLSAFAAAQTTVSLSTVAFGNVVNGTQSAAKTVTFTNTGTSPITVSSATVTASTPFAISPASTCLTTPTVTAGNGCTAVLTFSPTSLGAAPAASLTIVSTAGTNGTQTVALTGTGTNETGFGFPSINFGPVAVGESSTVWGDLFYNYKTTPITISSIVATAPYKINSTSCGSGLLPGNYCMIHVSLTPTALGPAPAGTLTVKSSAGNSPLVATLSGTGTLPATLSATSMNFNSVLVNTTSVTKTLTVYNWQPTALGITSISTALPYTIVSQTCGASVAAFSSCVISYNFKPTVAGSTPGTLTVVTDSSNSPLTLSMGGTGLSATSLMQPILYFGSVPVGVTSPIQSVTLTNNLSTPVSITSVAASLPFAITANNCPSSLAGGAHCVITLDFTPTAAGPVSASQLTVVTNAPDSPKIVTLTGTGLASTSVSPSSINFGNSQIVGETSAIKTVTLKNNQTTALTVSSLTVTAGSPYNIDPSSTCLTPTVAPGGSCTINVTVTPNKLYAQAAASLTIATNAGNSPLTVPLSAYALSPVYLSPVSIHFPSTVVGVTSAPQLVTVYNYQPSPLTFSSAIFNGPFVLDTGAETTCPVVGGAISGVLGAGLSCNIGVDFKPTTTGATTGGQITLLDSSANSPQTMALYGTGVIATTFAPTSLGFGNVVLGVTSPAQIVTFTNNQSVTLNFTSISVAAPYAVGPGVTTPCAVGTPLPAGGSCTLSVTLKPTTTGAVAATSLKLVDDAPSSPQMLPLTGAGVGALTLPSSLAFGNVVLNQLTTKSVTLTNNAGGPLTISSISGFTGGYSLDSSSTCSTTTPLGAGLSCTIAVDLTATTLGAQPAASFTVVDSAGSSPQTVTLSATAIQGVLVSPASLSFPTTFVGLSSASQPVTLTNEQATAITINSATITGTDPNDFNVTTSCPTTPNTVAPAGHCQMNVVFTPTATGTRTATLTIADTATGSPQTVSLSGTGNPPVVISPNTTQSFTAPVGTTSAYKTFTITNEEPSTALVISQIKLTGDFIQSATTCPIGGTGIGGAGATASCTVSVEFNPSIGGVRSGQLQVYDSALYTSPQVVNLTGTGTSPLTLSLSSLAFTAQTVGTVSASKLITLTNHETEPETFSVAAAGSLAATDYSASTNCATGVVAAQASCMIYVTFSPAAITPSTTRPGTLTVTNTAPGGGTLTASLTGSAIATNPPAAVASVSPGAGGSGTVIAAVITGNGWTHFSPSSSIAFVETTNNTIPCNIAVSGITSPNANTLDATLTLSGSIFGGCDVIVTTPLSGGGTETAKLVSAFNLADPTQAHVITTLNPAFGTQGQTLNVAITATGTHFVQGTTIANFGDGVSMNSLTIVDATDAVANITISNTTYVGYRTVTMQTNGEFAVSELVNGNPIFQIGANNAKLVAVAPNSEPQGWNGQVTVTATGSHFLQNATTVSIGGAIVGDVNVMSPTVAVAEVAVPAGAPIGPQNVTVATGGEIVGLNNAFTITGATPALLTVTPSAGQQGQALNVVITGNAYTDFVAGSLTANFTGEITTGSIVVNSTHQVTVPITIHSDANVGSITATLVSGTTNFPFSFTVTPSSASITSVTPTCAPQGAQLNLAVSAVNTVWVQGTTMSQFYPASVPTPSVDEVTINSPTSATLAIAVPTNSPAGTYGFYIATGGQVVSASINVCPATPTLTMSPANGLLPTAPAVNSFTANFTGQFTHWNATTLPVIAGEGVTLTNFVVTSPGSATGTVTILAGTNGTPTATGTRLVTFTTGGEIDTTYFNVTQTPVGILYVSPYHAAPSTTVNVAITGLNTHFNQATSVVQFGPQITVNSVTVTDATHLTANITTSYLLSGVPTPSASGYQNIFVNTGAEQVMGGFLVDYPTLPSIVSVNPSSGAQGATLSGVVITGNLTNWVQGTTEAILGAGVTVSNLTITSPTTATATIAISPTAPLGGNSVVMITGSQVVSGSGFSVVPSAAYIQSVEPNFSCPTQTLDIAGFNCAPGGAPTGVPVVAQLQTLTLNLVGVGTHWLQGETTVSFGPYVITDQLTVSSPTTAQVQITVLSAAPVGFATLTTSTDGEVVYLPQAIDIEEGSPTLLAISPSGAEQGTTLTLQILGRFTHFNQATTNAAFNQDITVNSINVIDSENMTANITVSPLAYVDFTTPCGHNLTVTTGNEQVTTGAILDNFCVAQGAEQINLVSPANGVQGSTETVTITGSATNFVSGETQVSFGDSGITTGTVQVNSLTSLTVPVAISTSSTVGYHTVTVTTLGEVATQQYGFNVAPGVATLNEAIPNQAEQGAPLTGSAPLVVKLMGQYSHFNAQSTATFGPGVTVLNYNFVSETEVDATITIDPLAYTGTRLVTVSSPGVPCSDQPTIEVVRALAASKAEKKFKSDVQYNGCTPGVSTGTGTEIVTNYVFTVIPGPAIISAVSPNTGNEGQEIVFHITGSGSHWAQNFTQFYIAGEGSDITVNSVVINSATSATVDMSISPTANPGARSVSMVTNGEALTDSGAFVVTGGVPVITYLSPNSQQNPAGGTAGLQVDIYGLYTNWATGTTVNFGPGITVENFQIDNATHIEAVINIAAGAQDGYRTVVVTTGTQALTGNFQVTAPAPPPTPYVWYVTPNSALPGQTLTVTINGAYTQWNPGTTVLEGFATGIVVNTFQVTSPTTARVNITIPANASASTSDLTLTTPGTTNNPSTEVDNFQFSVVIAQPTLSVIDPGSGLQGATNLTVDILGQYTTFDSTTTFNFGPNITVNGPPTILGPTIATQSISIPILAPLGYASVTASTPDAAAIAQTVTGAGFAITPSLALIEAIMPNTSAQGTTPTVEVTGQNTHWNSATTFSFGDGIVVTSAVVNSATDATLTLAIPAYAGEGPTSATAHTAGEVANINNGFVVTAGTPYLLSSGPGSVPQQGAAVFTILSQATNWTSANPPVVSYGAGITLTNVNVTGPTSLTVDGFVQPTTPVGYRNLTVSTGTQVLGLNNAVYVSPGPAVINSLAPNAGNQGVNLPAVQINGINTNWVQGTTTLTFIGGPVLINSFTVNSPTSITANITVNTTATAGQYSVQTVTGGEVATGVNVFTVSQSEPELLAVVPGSGPQGLTSSPVNLTADFTHFVNGTTTANFGTGITVNSVTVTSPTAAQANITVSPTTTLGARNVSVTTGTEVVNLSNAYSVVQGPAEIVGPLSPATGGEGNSYNIVITGSQTHFAQNVTTASFGGGIQVTAVTVNSLLSATVSITIPNSVPTGAYNVVLTTGGEVATILGGFTVTTGSAQILSVNPPTGTQGSNALSVALTGAFTHWVNGTSTVSFGSGITGTLAVTDATHATATINIGQTATIGSRNVTVTTGGEVATITGGFSVLAGVPQLLTVSPSSIQAGTSNPSVTITGAFTNFQQNFTTVSFGSGITVNLVTVNSPTSVTVSITAATNASVGGRNIEVVTNSQDVVLNGAFSVTAGTPVITEINPNIGTVGQTGLVVTINGLYTNWVNGTTKASFGAGISVGGAAEGAAGPVTVVNPTTLTATISVDPAATPGPVDVMTTTGGEVENVPGGFTIEPVTVPAPTLISLSPSASAGVMPINSNIIAVFSQPMNRTTFTTSTVSLTLTSNPNGYVTVPLTLNLDATGRVLTITPSGLLGVNSTYTLSLTGGIQDASGTAFNNYNVNLYTVYTANLSPTVLTTSNPLPNIVNVGTNVPIELEFSTTMNQSTQTGMTVSAGGSAIPGSYSWNSNPYCCGNGWAQPGTVLTFTPTTALTANTVYTVTYTAALADTAGNAVVPGSFTFTTGSGPDTANNNVGFNFENNQGNVGTNFAPQVTFAKPINPIDVNTGTLEMYNADSGKFLPGTVTVAANGLSAKFTPAYPLLPNTYYSVRMSGGYYDMDGNYLNGNTNNFTSGAGSDLTAPTVLSIAPANSATAVPLNAQITVHFNSAIAAASVTNAITVTPSGGTAVAGTATLESDLVTLNFVPTDPLKAGTAFTVHVSGYQDMVGNVGTAFSSTFTTAASSAAINVSTGLDSSGNLITANNTNDAHWTYVPVANLPGQGTEPLYAFSAGANATGPAAPLEVVGPGDTGWYSGWFANGPTSNWIAINPNNVAGNTLGVYSTTFNIPGPTVPTNLCLVGSVGIDDNGELALNGTAITGNISSIGSSTALSIPVSSSLVVGTNTLSLGWGGTDNSYEAFRLSGSIQTCGASYGGGLTVTSSTPASGATGVAANTTITLTFNNPLDPATVNATTLPVMIGYNSNQEVGGKYVVSGSQVVFTPDSPFPLNTQIYVGTCNGPVDLAGESAGGCYTPLINFTTGTTAPSAPPAFQVTAFAPVANATNVGLRAPVTATFNRSLAPGSINSNDFALFAGDSQSPWCTSYARSQDNTSLSFACYPLPSSAVMTGYLNSGLTDWSGNPLTSYTSQFTTGQYDSNTNGSLITSRPGNGASGIVTAEPITLYFNLPVDPSTANSGIEVAQNNVAVPGSVAVLDGGYTLEFTPSSAWTPGALIQWWTTGSLIESTYNTPVNGASGYFYAAVSTSTLAPAVQVASPSEYASGIPLNSIFDLQFNTPLNAATVTATNVYLYDSATTLNVPATISMPQPNEIRLTPTAALSPNHYIYVELTTGLQSTTSVPLASNQSWYEYTGTSSDTTLPTIVSAVPYNGSMGVGVNVAPGVVISKAIDPASLNGSTFTVTQGGTPLAGTYWINSGNTRIEFVPNAPLPASTMLTMKINGVIDMVGHPLTSTTSFTTGAGPDFQTPTVVWTTVSSNETVPVNSMLTIQFSESMDVTSFGANNLTIYDNLLGVYISSALTWNANQSIAYLVPASPLAAGRQYTLYVNGGTDLAGNQVSGFSQSFYAGYTSASAAPSVTAYNPLSGATGTGTNVLIEAQFSAPIDPTTLSGVTLTSGGSTVPTTVSTSAGNTVVQLVPASPLAPMTTYKFTIAGVKDPAGDAVATTSNSFTTGATFDVQAPFATIADPANGTTVGTNVTPKLVFNKPLNPLTVNNGSLRLFLNDTGQQIPLTLTESASGLQVTMTPLIALQPDTEYHIQACCGYQDEDGNNGNQSDTYFYTSGGTDTTGPTVTISPVNAATGVPLNAQVTATLSANIDSTSWTQTSIQVLQGGTAIAGTVTQASNTELVFTPASALTANTAYTVQVSGFKDANGNSVVTFSSGFTTGAVAATGGLTFTSASVTNGSNVTNNLLPITVTFSQSLNPSSVNLSTLLVMNSWNSAWGIAGTYVVNGNSVTFTPSSPYPPNATIYVGATGGLTDLAGDPFNGNAGAGWMQLVYFTTTGSTPDSTPLTVLSVNPAAGATNVRPDTPVSVTFNKGINPYSVYNNGNNALLFSGQGLQDRGSISMSPDNRTMTFSASTLYTGTKYTIQLPAGGISDPSGNTLATTFSSTFTTGTNPATGNGQVQTPEPNYNATGVPANSLLTLYMNRQVSASSLSNQLTVAVNGAIYPGTVQLLASGYEIEYTPSTAFPTGATVQWFLSGNLLDVYGDYFSGASGTFYTVATVNPATASPVVIAVSPSYGSSSVPINAKMELEYSQPVTAASLAGNVYLYNNSNNTNPAVTITPSSGSSTLVSLVPAAALNPSSQYLVCSNGSVMGANGVAATSSCWALNFNTTTVPDTTPGTVAIGPPNGSTSVGTNAYIRVTFSKAVDATTINATSIAITSGGNPIAGTWSYNYTNSDVREVNFSPLAPLPTSSTVKVVTSGLHDYAGNTFTPATATFTTAALPDYAQPTVQLDFGNGQTGVATNASFTCLYSAAMDPASVNASNTFVYSYTTSAIVPVTYTWATDMMAVTMKPVTALLANAQYYYYCSGAIDLTGNGQSGASASFTTGNGPSSVGPLLLSANPPSGATAVPLNTINGPWNSTSLTLKFSEPLAVESLANITFTPQGGSAEPIAVYSQDGGTIASVQLPYALVPNTQYTFNVAGVTDLNGNPTTSTTSSFTTGSAFDWNQPTVSVVSPANSATGVAVGVAPTVTFSEAMNPTLFDTAHVYLQTHNSPVVVPATIALSTNSAGSTVVTITPTTPLAESTIYDVVVSDPEGWYLYDIAGNYLNYNYLTYNQGYVFSTFTTGTTAAVNGACGSAKGQSFASAPSTNLCSAGTASAVTNPGSWSWTCNGNYGGSNASCTATVTGTPACVAQASSLVSLWAGNDNATDSGPGGNNGTLTNGVTYGLGEVGDAFSLNGNNQFVLIGEPVPTNLQIQNNLTLSAWIYPTALPTDYGSGAIGVIAGSQHDGNYAGATLYFDGRTNPDGNPNNVPPGHIGFNVGDGANWHVQDTQTQVPLNQWTLVTGVATAGSPLQVYFNGVLQPSNSGEYPATWNGTLSYSGSWFAIGQEVNENRPFTGLVNDVAVYNASLTPAQITAIYNAGSGGVCK